MVFIQPINSSIYYTFLLNTNKNNDTTTIRQKQTNYRDHKADLLSEVSIEVDSKVIFVQVSFVNSNFSNHFYAFIEPSDY